MKRKKKYLDREHATTQITEGCAHGELVVKDGEAIRVVHPLQPILPSVCYIKYVKTGKEEERREKKRNPTW